MIKPARAIGLERLELQRLRDRVGRLFAALQEATEAEDPLQCGAWAPPVDLCETDEAILIRAELPGLSPDEINIGLTSARLRIWGEKKRDLPYNGTITHLCSERSYGKFSRIVPLRWSFSVKAATAELANGILLVRLSKIEDRRGAEFNIKVKDAEED